MQKINNCDIFTMVCRYFKNAPLEGAMGWYILILWLYVFVHFSQKKIFLETKKFYVFYAFWTQAIILLKVVRRQRSASGGQNFNMENFNFKWFLNHLTDPLHTWYDGKTTWLTFNDNFSMTLIQGQISRSNRLSTPPKFIYQNPLDLQTSYLVPRYNPIRRI